MSKRRVCLVGYGSIGSVHAEAYRQHEDVLLSIVELDPVKRKQAASGHTTTYDSLDVALKYDHDLYDVCLPTHLHKPIVTQILTQTNAVVLCEKPLGMNAHEVREMQVLQNANRRLLCALVERFNQPFSSIKAWTSKCQGPYEMTFVRRTKKPLAAAWFGHPELGGDIVLDLAIHDIDLALWYVSASIISVRRQSSDNNSEAFLLGFKDGSTAHITSVWDLPNNHSAGIENHVLLKSNGGSIAYDSTKEELSYDVLENMTPRFPAAYYAEINAALAYVSGAPNLFPDLTTVLAGLEIFDKVKEAR